MKEIIDQESEQGLSVSDWLDLIKKKAAQEDVTQLME